MVGRIAPLTTYPPAGMVIMCDFHGLIAPEMVKERRVIVISPKDYNRRGRATVVPVSMSEPRTILDHHHKFDPGAYAFFHPTNPVWAICDMVYSLSFSRMSLVYFDGQPQKAMISYDDLIAIRRLVAVTLGMIKPKQP